MLESNWIKRFREFWGVEYVGSMRAPDPAIKFIETELKLRETEVLKELLKESNRFATVEGLKSWIATQLNQKINGK